MRFSVFGVWFFGANPGSYIYRNSSNNSLSLSHPFLFPLCLSQSHSCFVNFSLLLSSSIDNFFYLPVIVDSYPVTHTRPLWFVLSWTAKLSFNYNWSPLINWVSDKLIKTLPHAFNVTKELKPLPSIFQWLRLEWFICIWRKKCTQCFA